MTTLKWINLKNDKPVKEAFENEQRRKGNN